MQKFLLGVALLAALAWNLAHASEVKDLQLSSGATGTRAEIVLAGSGDYKILHLTAPARLVVDLPASQLADGLQVPAGTGVVKAIRTGHPVAGTTRIVFDLAQPVVALAPHIQRTSNGASLVLQWPGDGEATPVATAPAAPAPAPAASAPTPTDPAAASAAATSRLISQIAARAEAAASATAAGAPMPPASAPSAPTAQATVTAPTGIPTTVATGVPTRIATGEPAPVEASPEPAATFDDLMRDRALRPLVIAIDPGHGGQDPGAIGSNGTREKDVVLAISKELARQINAAPGLEAYLTRDTDVFIPLDKRAKLARAAGADMFISIHANAARNHSADGSSVFVLSLKGASSQRARWLANKENASDLVGGVRLEEASNTLASVLIDLTQSGQMKASAEAAESILDGLQEIGNVHKHEVERANFAVLRTSDMPAMLVETAFISNPQEERQLQDPGFQSKLAGAVLDGINSFFTQQPPPGTMYAARASAQRRASALAGGSR